MPDEHQLRVVVVAHSFVIPSAWARWKRLAERHPDVDVTLVSPAMLRTHHFDAEQVFRVTGEDQGNFRVRAISTTGRGLYRSLTLGLRRARPHVVQVNEEPTEWVLLQAFLAARALAPGASRLFYYYTNILTRPDNWHRRAKLQAILRLADGAFAGSKDSEQVLRDLGFRKSIYIQTEIGADERVWTPRDPHTKSGPFTIGFVGALTAQKGVVDLARATTALRGDWRFIVVGEGPERLAIKAVLTAAGVANRLDLRGLLERDAIPPVMRELDVLILPSRTMPPLREQFGLVLAEAMLSGVAVIGSSSGAIPDVIADGGLIFPEGDWRALSACLQSLLDDPGRRATLARAGRDRALSLYSASALAEQTYKLYRTLVDW